MLNGSLKVQIKVNQNTIWRGENRNMQIFHSVPNSNRLPGNTIYNHIYQENTGHESYDQMNATIIYQHLQTITHCPKTKGRMKNGNIKIRKTWPCFKKLTTFV